MSSAHPSGNKASSSDAKSNPVSKVLGRSLGRTLSPVFLADTMSAVSRSISPAVRPKTIKERRERNRTAPDGIGSTDSVTPGRAGQPKKQRSWTTSSSPQLKSSSLIGSGFFVESSDESDEEVVDEDSDSITIGPAAAAAAAAAEFASEQALADAELAGMTGPMDKDGMIDDSGARARSKTDEHVAKMLLFGSQLGGGSSGGRRGIGRDGGAGANSAPGKSLLSRKFGFSSKRLGGSGGGKKARQGESNSLESSTP